MKTALSCGEHRSSFVIGVWVVVLCLMPAYGDCPSNLMDRADVAFNPAGADYDVYFTDDNALSADFFSAMNAGFVRDALVNNHNTLVNAPLSFRAPNFSDTPNDVCIFDSGNVATAPLDRITVDAPNMRNQNEPFTRATIGHELFHHVQYAYINFNDWPSWGAWTVEATARAMEDKTFNDNDSTPMNTFYVGEVNGYLGNPNRTLMDISYTAALFWTYLMEQLGTTTAEPSRGAEVIRDFWERTRGNSPDSVRYLRDTIANFAPGRTLEDVFLDFAVANYTHSRNLSTLPAGQARRYQYVDESAAGGGTAFANVPTTAIPNASFNTVLNSSVVRWGAQYFDATVDVGGCEAVGFWGKAKDNKNLAWAVVAIHSGDRVTEIYRGTGNVFYRSFINNPGDNIRQLALVVAGLNDSADFEYAIGQGQIGGSIQLPTMSRLAFVGKRDNPERFQVRLLLQGPAVLSPEGFGPVSIRGLDSSAFRIELVSAANGSRHPATVINANYVSGEYWLAVQAPAIANAADGDLYHVEVCVCTRDTRCSIPLRSDNSVLYADVLLNQMLVLDKSFSMHYPEPVENSKIEAARNAARLYVHAAADTDKIGLVTFSGNNSECDDDAQLVRDMVPVAPNRDDMINAINGVVEDGWTSIGDGLKKGAQRLLASVTTPRDANVLVLLSDGLENEGDLWASANSSCSPASPPVRNSFAPGAVNAGIRVDTIAFGPAANRELLQNIATFTRGLFYDVASDAPTPAAFAAAGAGVGGGPPPFGAPTMASLEVPNRLANVYRTIEESTHQQDRLYFRSDRFGAGSLNFTVPVTERAGGGIVNAVFAFNWHLAAANVDVRLFNAGGAEINPGSAGWTIFKNNTHKTYHFQGILPPGNYRVSATAARPVQMISMLSGKLVRGVDIEVNLSQVRGAPPARECQSEETFDYLRGLPVDVSVNLNDQRGGIAGAALEVLVENPDGSVNRLSLHDDGLHGDGAAADGLYGNRYTRTPFFSRGGLPDFPANPPAGAAGGYTVHIRAAGKSNAGDPFERFALRSFHVYEFPDFGAQNPRCDPDRDNDGLPDRWEDLYGLDKTNPADAGEDYDLDGVSNKEEFLHGTLPFNADTDGGGESDGSEIANGRDPLYDRDDLLPAVVDYGVVTARTDLPIHEPQPETTILHFPVNTAYRFMEVWRTDPSWFGFERVARVDVRADRSGVYYDRRLQNGLTYLYYLVAEGESGARTPQTATFTASPTDDPLPPKGWILINQGATFTGTRNVTLQFDTSDDAKEVLISESPTFAGASWLPLVPQRNYTLINPVSGVGIAIVYAKFRDAAQNESTVYHDSIQLQVGGDVDNDGLADSWEIANFGNLARTSAGDEDGDGYSNLIEFRNGTDPRDPFSPRTGRVNGIRIAGGNLIIEFQGRLRQADRVEGPYTLVTGATSPYVVPATAGAKFYYAD